MRKHWERVMRFLGSRDTMNEALRQAIGRARTLIEEKKTCEGS